MFVAAECDVKKKKGGRKDDNKERQGRLSSWLTDCLGLFVFRLSFAVVRFRRLVVIADPEHSLHPESVLR